MPEPKIVEKCKNCKKPLGEGSQEGLCAECVREWAGVGPWPEEASKKTADFVPEDLDDVRDNPISYGLPEEAGTWTDDQILSALSEFADPEMVGASKKTAAPKNTPEDTAREMVGDGKKPNKYWVTTDPGFEISTKDDPNSYDYVGEVKDSGIAWNPTYKPETFGPFNSFKEAFEKLQELSTGIYDGGEPKEDQPNRVSIEDRMVGVVYETLYMGKWTRFGYRFHELTTDDTPMIPEGSSDDGEKVEGSKKVAVAPPGWEKTVKKMKNHPEIDNPWALSWYMKNKGYKPSASKKTADYQGWKNYETWAVALWLDNERDLQEKVLGWARGEDGVKDDYEVAERIKGLVEENNPLADQASMYADLMNGAISEVDFREVANHFVEATREIPKEGSTKVAVHPAGEQTMEGTAEPEVRGFDEEGIREEMAVALDSVPEDLDVGESKMENWGQTAYQVKDGNTTYTVVENEDAAEAMALAQVKEDLENEPELFTQDWLMSHVDEEAFGNLMEDDMSESNRMYADDIASESDKRYTNRLAAEMVQRGIITEEEGEDENFDLDSKKDEFVEAMNADQRGNDNFVSHVKDNFGEEFFNNLVKKHNLIDVESAAAEAVSMDGWAHFLSHYDGNYDTTAAGFVYWRD